MADYMSKAEFSRAITTMHALSNQERPMTDDDDISLFTGFGLKGFEPTVCTVRQLSVLIGWQCLQFNGQIDQEALQEVWQNRHKFIVVGFDSDADRQPMKDAMAKEKQLLARRRAMDKIMESV